MKIGQKMIENQCVEIQTARAVAQTGRLNYPEGRLSYLISNLFPKDYEVLATYEPKNNLLAPKNGHLDPSSVFWTP